MGRSELSFDGCGINGPDKYRTRIATFPIGIGSISDEEITRYGNLFAAAPELLTVLHHCDRLAGCQGDAQDISLAMGEIRTICRAAIAKAGGNS